MEPTATAVELDGQYRALREEAGYLRRARAALMVKGPDAAEYLQGQVTNDIEALAPSEGCYAALLDRKGHLTSDMRALRLEAGGGIWLDLEPAPAEAVLNHLRTYSIGRDVEVEDVGDAWAMYSVIGPRAEEATGFGRLGPEHAQRYREWDGTEVLAVATDVGVDLIVRADQADALERLLAEVGLAGVSEEAAEIIRVESGRPRFGLDMGPESMPAEAGIVERAVDFEKGCYIGQEPVARLHYRGKPNRTLRGLRLSASASAGESLLLGEKQVGLIGTASLSPALGPIALAIVRREAGPGDRLAVGDSGATAEVVELPFRD
ncbi:MAG TPA: glycine cleavage T C-terminal barrel domain-containing protein [Solirubrobacterales bacterium]|nr:glycine cleavage T C-terminal barrel domain-containing protein [Solirubrobacterales bacterium]